MFRPAQEQRWDPVEGFRPVLSGKSAYRELRGWSIIALGSLAIAGVFALLLAISRIPGADTLFPWPVAFYHKSLIIHVVFSFVVWFLAIGIILMQTAAFRLSEGAPLAATLGKPAIAAMAVAFVLLAAPALMDRGVPSLNNYVPAITDPVYYVGLLLVGFAAVLAAVRALANAMTRSGPLEPIGAAGLACAVIALPVLILGGFTSVPGAIVGGLIIGVGEKVAEVFAGPYVGGAIENWFAYVLALAFLLIRPQGLFGEKIIERV